MTTATSASDRYDAARAVLAEIPHILAQVEASTDADGMDEVFDARDSAADALTRAESALRALIEPPATDETAEKAAMRVYMGIHSFPWIVDGDAMRDLIQRGYLAGIQAAWESWEPENAPGHGQSWEYGVAGDSTPQTALNRVTTSPRPEGWSYDEALAHAQGVTRKSHPSHVERRIVTDWEEVKP